MGRPADCSSAPIERATPRRLTRGRSPEETAKRSASSGKVSPVRQTRGAAGLMLVKRRKIRSPRVGRVGKESTCSRSLRA